MMLRLRWGFFTLAATLTGWGFAQTTPAVALLILSKQDRTLSIVNPAKLQVVARIPAGDDPHEVVVSKDGRTAYVSNYGFGAFHTLTEIDLVGQRNLATIDLGALRGPHGLAFQQGKVWFTAEVAKSIGSYNPATGKIDWIMGTGQNRTHMLYVFPGAKRIITTNVNSATVTILDKVDGYAGVATSMPGTGNALPLPPGGDWQLTVIPVGRGSEGFDVSPDGKQAWVANAGDGTVSIIDVATKTVTATIEAKVPHANRLKLTPDGKMALISAGPELVILDAATHQEIKRLTIGTGSGGILVQPDGLRAYVACSPNNNVAVIDMKSLEVVGRIQTGGNPDGMAWAVQQ
ncbi:MAG: YncE family protein [Terracidiphilus sp.]